MILHFRSGFSQAHACIETPANFRLGMLDGFGAFDYLELASARNDNDTVGIAAQQVAGRDARQFAFAVHDDGAAGSPSLNGINLAIFFGWA